MIRYLRSLFAWREFRDNGVWVYFENAVSGCRKAIRVGGCYQPLDFEWLAGGARDGWAYDHGRRIRIKRGSIVRSLGTPPRPSR
ncbi:hypothetical protein EDF56_106329 [Novosphingobium sp. PhB165]|uniref:hypothetical protein n=1 Tax=Novosphingobium sp. PhB165 TaxID=2485105 RepID=UPI001052A701|nr:hypothetical protein [Novosphingobium sp. PhB165]TCM17213.1 hypothetical protein EDF56_106329 [Novosphingobium sp. PhB165]